jgi:hypothetical protein
MYSICYINMTAHFYVLIRVLVYMVFKYYTLSLIYKYSQNLKDNGFNKYTIIIHSHNKNSIVYNVNI